MPPLSLRLFHAVQVMFLIAIASIGPAAAADLPPAYPVHGIVVRQTDANHAVVRMDAIEQTTATQTKRYHLAKPGTFKSGTEIDAILQGDTLKDVTPYGGYTAGIPDDRSITTLNLGDTMPSVHVVDQRGQLLDLGKAWLGKTVVLSFVFTRCPDAQICPAISGKFAYLQDHLDSARTHLVEVTLDPRFDSPKVLAEYATRYGAVPEKWSVVTAEQNQIALLINQFGLSNLENRPGNFEHDDTLAVIGTDGKILQLIPTAGWAPDDVVATVLHHQGGESNWFRRMELAAIAGVISVCGGSITTGQVVLDSVVFILGVLFFGGLLYVFGRRIWRREPH